MAHLPLLWCSGVEGHLCNINKALRSLNIDIIINTELTTLVNIHTWALSHSLSVSHFAQ